MRNPPPSAGGLVDLLPWSGKSVECNLIRVNNPGARVTMALAWLVRSVHQKRQNRLLDRRVFDEDKTTVYLSGIFVFVFIEPMSWGGGEIQKDLNRSSRTIRRLAVTL